jgi:hypothetical protein
MAMMYTVAARRSTTATRRRVPAVRFMARRRARCILGPSAAKGPPRNREFPGGFHFRRAGVCAEWSRTESSYERMRMSAGMS